MLFSLLAMQGYVDIINNNANIGAYNKIIYFILFFFFNNSLLFSLLVRQWICGNHY